MFSGQVLSFHQGPGACWEPFSAAGGMALFQHLPNRTVAFLWELST